MLIALIGIILFCGALCYFWLSKDETIRAILALLLLPLIGAVLTGLGCAIMGYEQDYCQLNMRAINDVRYQCSQKSAHIN